MEKLLEAAVTFVLFQLLFAGLWLAFTGLLMFATWWLPTTDLLFAAWRFFAAGGAVMWVYYLVDSKGADIFERGK